MRRDHIALIAFLEDRETWAFGYGPEPRTHDCVRFVCDAAEAQTGLNPLKGFDGRWTTEIGAARVLRRHGGLGAAFSTVLREIDPPHARRGDIALVEDGETGPFMVLIEGDLLVGASAAGLVRLPRASAARTWSLSAPLSAPLSALKGEG